LKETKTPAACLVLIAGESGAKLMRNEQTAFFFFSFDSNFLGKFLENSARI